MRKIHFSAIASSRHEPVIGPVDGQVSMGRIKSIYKNALAHELRKAGIPFVRDKRGVVCYDGIVTGEFSADFLVDSRVIVKRLAPRPAA